MSRYEIRCIFFLHIQLQRGTRNFNGLCFAKKKTKQQQAGSGTFFENTIIVQFDPQVQEVWDQARKLRCTWHDQYEKSVTFRPFPVDMLDVVRADFAGDNVGCWMQIQVGKGPWASEVSGLVKIGQTMTMVLAIKDDDGKFDMLVRNCMAHDGKRAPIQLVDQRGCVTRPKLMSRFTKIKNFGSSASVLSYAHFQVQYPLNTCQSKIDNNVEWSCCRLSNSPIRWRFTSSAPFKSVAINAPISARDLSNTRLLRQCQPASRGILTTGSGQWPADHELKIRMAFKDRREVSAMSAPLNKSRLGQSNRMSVSTASSRWCPPAI